MQLTVVYVLCVCLSSVVSEKRVKRIVGGNPADEPYPDASAYREPVETESPPTQQTPLVFVTKDKKPATVNGIKNADGSFKFLGIRYGEPPVGLLRFQRPKRVKLSGVVDATKYGPPCIQPAHDNNGYIGSEDCLFLNVYAPQGSASVGKNNSGCPVIVWFHGGNFRRGSAAQYDPQPIVKQGVMVVTVQYRLGSLGFLSIGRKELPGNAGLFDAAAALTWVRTYIGFFGGDSRSITPAGQGSGATIASFLGLNQLFRRYVKGIIAMSGSAVSSFSVDKTERQTAKDISAIHNCSLEDGLNFVRCMQHLTVGQILQGDTSFQSIKLAASEFPKSLATLTCPGPAEEGREDDRFLPFFLQEPALTTMKKDNFSGIPLLTGVTKEESATAVHGTFFHEIATKLLSPAFLQTGLFRGLLQANTGLYANKTVSPQLSALFQNAKYLQFFPQVLDSALSDVEKVVRHTTDALFNLPAYVTSSLWSAHGEVYLYSFEHSPRHSMAEHFLPGSRYVKNLLSSLSLTKKGPSHGDDISFLFNSQSLFGVPIKGEAPSVADMKVQEDFTDLVAEFARTGQPKISRGPKWMPFGQNTNYMVISETPKLKQNFRKCQMALWTGDNNLLTSSECSYISAAAKIVTDTLGSAGSTLLKGVGTVTNPIVKPLTNLFQPILPTKRPGEQSTTPRGLLSGLGGILG